MKIASALKANLLKKLVEFYRTMHGPMMPETLDTLEGADASIFMKTFSESKGKSVPKSGIKVCILYLTQGATGEPWIYAGSTSEEVRVDQKPLASPVPVSVVFSQLDKQIQNFIYGTGFALMAVSSLVSIVHRTIAP